MPQQLAQAMNNPEMQQLMNNPEMQRMVGEMRQNPAMIQQMEGMWGQQGRGNQGGGQESEEEMIAAAIRRSLEER